MFQKFYLEGKEACQTILHPDYADNGWIYGSYSALLDDGQNTFVDRIKIKNNSIFDRKNVFKAKALRSPPVHYEQKWRFLKMKHF